MAHHVLVVDDDRTEQFITHKWLNKHGFAVSTCSSGSEAVLYLKDHHLQGANVNLILLDLHMPNVDGMEVLDHVKANYPEIPVIMVTASTNIDDAVNAIKSGATDFITKPIEPQRMLLAVENSLKLAYLGREVRKLRLQQEGNYSFNEIIGANSGLYQTVKIAQKAAKSALPVLVTGESGVGKELFARSIHTASNRSDKPFIEVNCAAIPENLVESLLFGHKKGAFTGADADKEGMFEKADGGTLFLDEIGELPLTIQAKLLRVLQEQTIQPVGSVETKKIDVRIIAATNRTLEDEVQQGSFREDLFFRISVLQILVPPLRERPEDIIPIAEHLLEQICFENNIPATRSLAVEAKQLLNSHQWSGNVRELQNVITRAVILSDNMVIKAQELAKFMYSATQAVNIEQSSFEGISIDVTTTFGDQTLEEVEKAAIANALERYSGNVTKTARQLDIAKSTLYKKIRKYQL